MWWRKRRRRRGAARRKKSDPHYAKHKELAREIIHERINYWNQYYSFTINRVAIKNQRRCWGSCSEHGNLNFSYKIIFLPHTLMDYVIVHELCHLAELNHSPAFWMQVAKAIPDYQARRVHLRKMTHIPERGFPSSIVQTRVSNSDY